MIQLRNIRHRLETPDDTLFMVEGHIVKGKYLSIDFLLDGEVFITDTPYTKLLDNLTTSFIEDKVIPELNSVSASELIELIQKYLRLRKINSVTSRKT